MHDGEWYRKQWLAPIAKIGDLRPSRPYSDGGTGMQHGDAN